MPSEKTEKTAPSGFLAVLEAKYAALGKLIESYRAADSLGALGQPGDLNVSVFEAVSVADNVGASVELPQGALLGKSLPAAIKLYLSAIRKKQTTREITVALKAGGVESTAASFENNVTSALHRLKAIGEVLKFNEGWGLAEFYPENLRNRIAAQSVVKPKAVTSKKRGHQKMPTTKKTATARRRSVSNKPSIDTRIAAYVAARPIQVFSSAELGAAVNELNVKRVGMALARLQGRGKIVKRPDGVFAAPRHAEHLKAV